MTSRACPLIFVSNHGDIVGGGELSLLDLLFGLDRTQWEPHIVVPSEGEMSVRCRNQGLATYVIPLPALRIPSMKTCVSIVQLMKLIGRTGAKLLHANGSRAMFYAGVAGALKRCSVIWHVRVSDSDSWWDRVLSKMAHTIIVNSKAVEQRVKPHGPHKVRCVYNGVDLRRFQHTGQGTVSLRASLGLTEQGPVIVSIGRFVPFKGYEYLLEAAELIDRERKDLQWLLVGDGELKEDLVRKANDLGLNGKVHFLGWCDNIPPFLEICDVFVLPSLNEHFGRVLIEAMAMKRPVVATLAGGVPEIVKENLTGFLVQPANPTDLAQAIQKILRNPSLGEQFGQAGRQRVEQHFSLRQHVSAIESIYHYILGRACETV